MSEDALPEHVDVVDGVVVVVGGAVLRRLEKHHEGHMEVGLVLDVMASAMSPKHDRTGGLTFRCNAEFCSL